MIWMLELLRNYALQEKYNIQKIGSQIKENRLLFEMGEITKEEYEKEKELLLEERKKAEEKMASLSEDMKIREL